MSGAPVTRMLEVDALILGAGINGAGVFRDLCEQGLTCAIIDKADFCAGTSAAPSRLIHGGLKYLETGEFGLVAQSTLERNLLLKNAPHLVTPLPTIIPIFSWLRGVGAALRTLGGSTTAPRSRGAVLIKLGLMMYDAYGARHRVMPRHALWSRRRALREMPPLTPRIVAAGKYYDAMISHPERLVLELVQDGLRASPASVAMTYTRLHACDGTGLLFARPDGETIAMRPRIVINAAGPWIDRVNATLGIDGRLIGGTKGSHILLDHPLLIAALQGRMLYFEADDGRICLVFDYLGRALVGSTDSRADDPDTVRCEADEVAYFLDSLRRLLPGLTFPVDQIVYTYSGIRPLPATDGAAAGLISRDHSAPVAEPDATRRFAVISLVGGKWTTFRGFAEEVSNTVLARLGLPRKVSTRTLPIGGGRKATPAAGEPSARARVLMARYGSTAGAILIAEGEVPRPLRDAPDFTLEEFAWMAAHEQVVHLTDLILRRSTLAITGRLSLFDLHQIAVVAAQVLAWDKTREAAELAQTLAVLRDRHGQTLT